jgi:hypothetical protein
VSTNKPNLNRRYFNWPQWGGSNSKNMVSEEKGLPDSFVPGEKDSPAGRILMETTKNVKWAAKLCQAIYSTPAVAGGKIFIGGRQPGLGLLMCLDEKTGKLLWQWEGPARKVPAYIDGFLIGIGPNPEALGVSRRKRDSATGFTKATPPFGDRRWWRMGRFTGPRRRA